jgi:hypothetical protein
MNLLTGKAYQKQLSTSIHRYFPRAFYHITNRSTIRKSTDNKTMAFAIILFNSLEYTDVGFNPLVIHYLKIFKKIYLTKVENNEININQHSITLKNRVAWKKKINSNKFITNK